MSRVYISGPINGVEGYIDNFKAAEKYLLDKGHEVINPVAVSDALPNMEYEELMALDIMLITMCESIYMMKGWNKSLGCNREYGYAIARNMNVIFQQDENVAPVAAGVENDNKEIPIKKNREYISVEEILKERETMTYKEISEKHGIPASTLCCRVQKYLKHKAACDEEKGKREDANKKKLNSIKAETVPQYDVEEIKDYYMFHDMADTAKHFDIPVSELRRIIINNRIFKNEAAIEEYRKAHNAIEYGGGRTK